MKKQISLGIIACLVIFSMTAFAQELIPDPVAADPEFEAAYELYNQGKHDEAIPLFKNILQNDPSHLRAQVYLGVCYMGLETWEMAIEQLHKALTLGEKYPLTNYALSVCYARKTNPNIGEARKYLKYAKEYGYYVPTWFEGFIDRLESGNIPPQTSS